MFVILYACLLFAASTHAYPTGAPPQACTTMTPLHGSNSARPLSSSPYSVSASSDVNQLGAFTITISSSTNTPFKGILLQARATASGSAEGTWQVPTGGLYKNLDCYGATGALTHTSRVEKSTPAQFTWTAPSNPATYTIYATVVTNFTTFYVKIPSSAVSVQASATTPVTTTTIAAPTKTTTTTAAHTKTTTTTAASSTTTTAAPTTTTTLLLLQQQLQLLCLQHQLQLLRLQQQIQLLRLQQKIQLLRLQQQKLSAALQGGQGGICPPKSLDKEEEISPPTFGQSDTKF